MTTDSGVTEASAEVLTGWAATVEAMIFASAKPVRVVELQNHLPENIDPQTTSIHPMGLSSVRS